MPTDLDRWASRQINAAIRYGVHPLDAARAVREFLRLLPLGADPDTYIVPAARLEQDLTSAEVLADVRAAWYGSENVEPKYKRLLDSRGT